MNEYRLFVAPLSSRTSSPPLDQGRGEDVLFEGAGYWGSAWVLGQEVPATFYRTVLSRGPPHPPRAAATRETSRVVADHARSTVAVCNRRGAYSLTVDGPLEQALARYRALATPRARDVFDVLVVHPDVRRHLAYRLGWCYWAPPAILAISVELPAEGIVLDQRISQELQGLVFFAR